MTARERLSAQSLRRHGLALAVAVALVDARAGGDEAAALFGNLSVGVAGYLAILTQVVLMAMVTALTSVEMSSPSCRRRTLASGERCGGRVSGI